MMKRYLPESEQSRLLDVARRCSDPLAQRDYHWMSVLLLTGMRISEFSHLRVKQVCLALRTGWLVSRPNDCKGGRGNEYPVTTELRKHLAALVRFTYEDGPLVPGRFGEPLTPRSYQQRVKLWANEAGIDPRISPHWFRHTRGMNILRRSRGKNPLKVVQMALGHASLKSTGVYLHLSREELSEELQAVDGGRLRKCDALALVSAWGDV